MRPLSALTILPALLVPLAPLPLAGCRSMPAPPPACQGEFHPINPALPSTAQSGPDDSPPSCRGGRHVQQG